MWSKIFHWKSKKNNAQEEPAPADLVRLALAEIDKNIAQNQKALADTKATQAQLQAKLREQLEEMNKLQKQAETFVKKGDEISANVSLNKKVWLEEQAKQYQHLLAQLAQTTLQLEQQIAGLEVRKVEISTRETLLTAQLQKANSQKEMQSYLGELDKTLGFEDYERQIESINIENQLANDILAFDTALEQSKPVKSVQEMQNQLAAEENAAQAQKMNGIFGRYFDANKLKQAEKQNTQDLGAMREGMLASFFAQKDKALHAPTEADKSKVDAFFAQDAPQNLPTEAGKTKVDAFFAQDVPQNLPTEAEKTTDKEATGDKNSLINQFFADKPEEPKSDKQKRIDDFFKS